MHTAPVDPPPSPVPVRYDYLDALRGWAILGVLATHATYHIGGTFAGANITSAGKYGVQLFFVVSAFTIFLTLDRARWKGWWTCAEFYVRRFFRILPMFWVGLVLYAFVPGRVPHPGLTFTPLDYVLTAFAQHGWVPTLVNTLVPGGWSIAVESTFYLCAPLCFRMVRNWRAALWLLLGSLAAAVAANRALLALYVGGHVFASAPREFVEDYFYAWLPNQWSVFACGILAYHLVLRLEPSVRDRSVGAVLLAVSAVWIGHGIDLGDHGWVDEHVFFALGFVPLVLGLRLWPAPFLVNPATQFLGKVSYSAYLLHFVVLELALNSLDTFLEPAWQNGLTAFALLFTATLVGTVPLAWLAHRYVERPGIDLGAWLIRWRRARVGAVVPAPEPASWPLSQNG